MGRKPNYSFERNKRAKAKAAKKEAKRLAKQAAREAKKVAAEKDDAAAVADAGTEDVGDGARSED